jgi:hypothetical protein
MNSLPHIHHRQFIACLALTLAILGSSFGVAKSASAAAPEHPAAVAALSVRAPAASGDLIAPPTADRAERVVHAEVPTLRHHLAHLEVESGEVRHPLETLNLATARPVRPGHAERPA